jgi:uroporphyrinogen-III synthase
MSFEGLAVLALESRRAAEICELILRQGGKPCSAPAVRETPASDGGEVREFGSRLLAGDFDMFVLLTGVGVRALRSAIGEQLFASALRRLTTVARGPKPVAALREMGLSPNILAPPPHTWREVLAATEGRPESRIAVQEYGRRNEELLAGLRARGAAVTPVHPYIWEMPEDIAPLERAAHKLAVGGFDVALFTTGVQVVHLFRLAAAAGLERPVAQALSHRTVVASIGPTTTEALEEFGIAPDLEPSQAKMGILVKEAAEQAHAILARKLAA